VCCNASTDVLVTPFSFTIAYVDPDIAGKRVCETNTQLFYRHWSWGDELGLQIVASIVDITILPIVNNAIAGLFDPHENSECLGAATRSPMETVVCTPVMLCQSSISVLLPDGSRWRQNYRTQCLFVTSIVDIMRTEQLVPRHLIVVAAAIILGMTSSYLQPWISTTISGRIQIAMGKCGA